MTKKGEPVNLEDKFGIFQFLLWIIWIFLVYFRMSGYLRVSDPPYHI